MKILLQTLLVLAILTGCSSIQSGLDIDPGDIEVGLPVTVEFTR